MRSLSLFWQVVLFSAEFYALNGPSIMETVWGPTKVWGPVSLGLSSVFCHYTSYSVFFLFKENKLVASTWLFG